MTPWFPAHLAGHGDRVALVTESATISYRDLAERVGAAAERLGPRRLVLLAAANTADAIVTYLAALAGGHPVLLVPETTRRLRSLTDAYDPDVVAAPADRTDRSWRIDERHATARHTSCTPTWRCC